MLESSDESCCNSRNKAQNSKRTSEKLQLISTGFELSTLQLQLSTGAEGKKEGNRGNQSILILAVPAFVLLVIAAFHC